jgi:hypothetical protein
MALHRLRGVQVKVRSRDFLNERDHIFPDVNYLGVYFSVPPGQDRCPAAQTLSSGSRPGPRGVDHFSLSCLRLLPALRGLVPALVGWTIKTASRRFMDRLTTDEAEFTLNSVQDLLLLLCSYIMVTVLINCPRFLSSQATAYLLSSLPESFGQLKQYA